MTTTNNKQVREFSIDPLLILIPITNWISLIYCKGVKLTLSEGGISAWRTTKVVTANLVLIKLLLNLCIHIAIKCAAIPLRCATNDGFAVFSPIPNWGPVSKHSKLSSRKAFLSVFVDNKQHSSLPVCLRLKLSLPECLNQLKDLPPSSLPSYSSMY